MKPSNHHSKKQTLRNNALISANNRGVFAIRRPLEPESYQVIHDVTNSLRGELHNSGRLFDVRSLGVTVIGFSRFDRAHRRQGPPTTEIIASVESSRHKLSARLGKLAVFGSETKGKLGIILNSEDLNQEVENFENEFQKRDFKLIRDPNDHGIYTPHLSICLLYSDHLNSFKDSRTLHRLNKISNLGSYGNHSVTLGPTNTISNKK